MVDIFRTATSGLLASQRSLATTGHNIANVNDPDFTRQRVELAAATPQLQGSGYVGRGVRVTGIRRIYDEFLNVQVRTHTAGVGQLEIVSSLTRQLGSLVGDPSASLSPAMQRFFDAAQGLANDPGSTPARRVLLSEAESLAARFRDMNDQMNALRENVNNGLSSTVTEINGLAEAIAAANQDIVLASGQAGGGPASQPNDLLDHRDGLLRELAAKVEVQTVEQSDGSLAVFVGSGQALVVGSEFKNLIIGRSPYDPQDLTLRVEGQNPYTNLSSELTGGRIGGYLAFRRDVLDPAQSTLGLLATGFGETFNAQHALGMDQEGELGEAFFVTEAPRVLPHAGNASTQDNVTAVITDVEALQRSDYELSYNGVSYVLSRLSDATDQVLGGAGTYTVDGLEINIGGGTPTTGDRFLIQPARNGAHGFGVAIQDTRDVAAAVPVRSQMALSNTGSGVISSGRVADPADPALRNTVQITFNDPSDTFDLVDLDDPANNLTGQPYLPGQTLTVNGWELEIGGSPDPGDSFQVSDNSNGIGDNRNALALAELQKVASLLGGSSDYQGLYSQLVAEVGTQGSRIDSSLDAQQVLLDRVTQDRDAVSAVNLDEEAADLMRFQQTYDASAQLIRVADSLFRTILDAVRS